MDSIRVLLIVRSSLIEVDMNLSGFENDWFDLDPIDDFGNPLVTLNAANTSKTGTMDM